MEFHNSTLDFNKLFYNVHADLIKRVCEELQAEDKADELIEKLLTKTFTKIKPMKDPERPKKPKSSYMFFCESRRDKIKEKFPNTSMGEMSKKLGKEWQSLSEDDKETFVSLANKDKERYEEELEAYKNK